MSSKVVALIPARKGSKRLPGKNKKELCGKPLISYTIEQALACDFIDEVIVSTDDDDIMNLCLQYPYLKLQIKERPDSLSQDDSSVNDVIIYELRQYSDLTTVILLQPTSPLRTPHDIQMACQIFKERVSCTVIPVFREDEYHFKLNGAVFVFTLGALRLTKDIVIGEFICAYVMPKERSIDIDTLEDFQEAERLMKRRLGI